MVRVMRRALLYLLIGMAACERAPRLSAGTATSTPGVAQVQAGDAPSPANPSQPKSPGDTPVASAGDPAPAPPSTRRYVPLDIPRIDVHTHIESGALQKAVALLGRHHI